MHVSGSDGGYARNLARARLTNAISIAWDAVVGQYDPDPNRRRVVYQFGSITTADAPDFQALCVSTEILKRQEVGKKRARREEYSREEVATELTIFDKLATVVEDLRPAGKILEAQHRHRAP